MGRFGGQAYPPPRWRRAAPAAQERVEGKSQTAPKETLVARVWCQQERIPVKISYQNIIVNGQRRKKQMYYVVDTDKTFEQASIDLEFSVKSL
jgi:hypothetical protein